MWVEIPLSSNISRAERIAQKNQLHSCLIEAIQVQTFGAHFHLCCSNCFLHICDYDIDDDDDDDDDCDDYDALVLQLIEPTVFHLMMMIMIMMIPDNDGEDKNHDFQMMTVCEQS